MPLQIVILAAGQGKRMYSETPKVLHAIGGKAMLAHVIETAMRLQPQDIHVVIGHGGAIVRQELAHLPVHWVLQATQLGTGHAVLQTLPFIADDDEVLILSGDVPLIRAETLRQLIAVSADVRHQQALRLLVAHVAQPFGLGRILRDQQQQVYAIVEERDASDAQKAIQEIYSGICCAPAGALRRWLQQIKPINAQNEHYLTDIIALAVAERMRIETIEAHDTLEIQGINNRAQLHDLNRAYQRATALALLAQGVTIQDVSRIDIRGELSCQKDVFIDVNVVFEGRVELGDRCRIGPNCLLSNVILGNDCTVAANSVMQGCTAGDACHIGPFAHIRPGTVLADHCKVGNFVEIKNSIVGEYSKASHLSYLGDAIIGKQVNIGAGTITCNYDGVNKHQTVIEDGVFIGSDTQLIAPVTIGKDATIGAGSSIRHNVPGGQLTLTIAKQKTILGWQRPEKTKSLASAEQHDKS